MSKPNLETKTKKELCAMINDLNGKLKEATKRHQKLIAENTEASKQIQELRGKISTYDKQISAQKAEIENYKEEVKGYKDVTLANEDLQKEARANYDRVNILNKSVAKYKLTTIVAVVAFIIALCFACF